MIYCITYKPFDWRQMQYGAERRKAIIDHILVMDGLPVNRKYVPQVHEDPDLKKMLKKGLLKQERRGISSSSTTFLFLK